MIQKNKYVVYCLLTSLLFISCIKEVEPVVGSLSGIITDYQSNTPLAGATVTIDPLGDSYQTGSNGHYEFLDLSAQEYIVTVDKANYVVEKKTVFVELGKNNKLDFSLRSSFPKLKVTQETMDFGNDATTLTLDIKNLGTAVLSWQVNEDITWLSCIPTSGEISPNGSASVVVNVNRQGVPAGSYSQTLGITSNGGSAVVKVNMTVQGMAVSVSPQELDFGTTTSVLTLTMSGGDNVSYTLTPSNDWIIPGKSSGVFSQTENVVVSVDRTGFSEGNYTGSLSLKVGEHSKDIPVRMTILSEVRPTVTLSDVVNITASTATFKGGVISVGSTRITKHGFCWGKEENPEIEVAEYCNFGDCPEAKDFVYNVSLLEENTTFYVRAFAENGVGISYSNQLKFTTSEAAKKPEVQTGTASNIQSAQVDVSGKILNLGHNDGIVQHGHVWSRTADPTIDNMKTELGSVYATGGFVSTITGLEPNVTYHVRAYATNSIGTSYGKDVTFTTATDIVTLTTTAAYDIIHNEATVAGSISYYGGNTIVERGVCWDTDQNPTISNSHKASSDKNARFEVRIDGLSELTNYHVRAYVITANDNVYYGNDMTFSTTHEIHLPQAANTTISNIGTTFATFYSSIVSDGDGNISDCGFCYSRTPNPTVEDNKVSLGKKSGTFVTTVKDLNENTTYYVRSYVINEAGTAYGEEVNFATLEILPPTLSDVTLAAVTHRSASWTAQILSANNGTISDAGFVYSTSPSPGLTNHKTSTGNSFEMNVRVNSLSPQTTYYVRAYAVNEKGTAFSKEFSFTTKEEPEGSSIEVDDFNEDIQWD